MFEYEFKIEGDMPPTANSRPIPFALRAPVREQIQEMGGRDIRRIIFGMSTHLH